MANDLPQITADIDKVGHCLTIKIPLGLLEYVAERAPFIHSLLPSTGEGSFTVTNQVLFARNVAERLLAERTEDVSILCAAVDDAIEEVVDNDMPGWEWPRAGITRGRD